MKTKTSFIHWLRDWSILAVVLGTALMIANAINLARSDEHADHMRERLGRSAVLTPNDPQVSARANAQFITI